MNKSRAGEFAIIFIVLSMIYMGFSYFVLDRNSNTAYDMYLDGEYYFRAEAYTKSTGDWWEFTDVDHNDPRYMICASNGVKIYAYDLNGRYCTVYHDGDILHDYPIANLEFRSDEEKDIFYGHKVYTLEEYEARVEALPEDSPVLGDPDMKNGESHSAKQEIFITIVVGYSAILGLLYVFTRSKGVFYNGVLVIWTTLVFIWDILSFFILF
ncbi:MAG: hypothetical protein J5883_06510 [Clostridiales bacterium]|nr:hypothetical protein [Clostridiales bacterium]